MKTYKKKRKKSGSRGRFYGRLFQIILLVAFTFTIYQILLEEDKTEDIYSPKTISEELEDVGQSTKNLVSQEYNDFKNSTESRLNKIDQRINELDREIGKKDAELEQEAKEELEELKRKKELLENRMDEMNREAAEDWQKMKSQVNTTLNNLEEDLDRLFDSDNIAFN